MRVILKVFSAALGLSCLAAAARSQTSRGTSGGTSGGGMGLSSRIQLSYSQAYRDSAGGRIDWMQYVILWRGQPEWQSGIGMSDADREASRRAYEEARIAALTANRGFFGAGGANPYWGEIDRDEQRLSVLGKDFALPPMGSTLVVLIDRIDRVGGPPVIVASAVIDGVLPPETRSKTWTSGDTTFTVRPSKSGLESFLETLKQDPAIAAFLGETPRLH